MESQDLKQAKQQLRIIKKIRFTTQLITQDEKWILYNRGETRHLTIDDTHSVRLALFFFWVVFHVLKSLF
jgi:type VI protein secretion system component VasA